MNSTTSTLPRSFQAKKAKIISSLSVPTESYDDLSPKGSIDVGIRDLIDEINAVEGWVTTSSCAGRVSVFLEGVRARTGSQNDLVEIDESSVTADENGDVRGRDQTATVAGTGGKGGGGRWLFVSHDPIDMSTVASQGVVPFLGMEDFGLVNASHGSFSERRLIHFKFEPLILHVLTASPPHAQTMLTAGFGAGFRESGALNLLPSATSDAATPMVAIRSMGLSLESVVGYFDGSKNMCFVSEDLLVGLLKLSNERFVENTQRIERLRVLLRKGAGVGNEVRRNPEGEEWEDAGARRERKRAEGLRRKEELLAERMRRGETEDSAREVDAGDA